MLTFPNLRGWTLALLGAFLIGGLAACAEEPENLSPPLTVYLELAPLAPPAPLEEAPLSPEDPSTQVWRPGFWAYHYATNLFTWTVGELIARPSPTAVWEADRWVTHDYGWAFVPGHWL